MIDGPFQHDKDDPDYVEKLIDACIEAFEELGKDSSAMNYVGVDEKLRPIVLGNTRYKRETRMAKAKKQLEEIREVKQIGKTLKSDTPKEMKYDPRNPPTQKDADAYNKEIKENLTLRLKVMEIERGLFSTDDDDDKNAAAALNIYFIPVTKEEFAALDTVEVHDGTEDAGGLKEQSKIEKHEKSAGVETDESPDPFIIDAEGDMVELQFP